MFKVLAVLLKAALNKPFFMLSSAVIAAEFFAANDSSHLQSLH